MKLKSFILAVLFFLLLGSFSSTVFAAKLIEHASKNRKLLSLNFQEISTRAALNLLAEFSGVEIIVSDKVQGNMSLHLKDVTWKRAKEVILQTQGLMETSLGNILFIAPAKEIMASRKLQQQEKQLASDNAPLQTFIIKIHHAQAKDIATLLEANRSALLGKHGTIVIDKRTNSLWIEASAKNKLKINQLLASLDVPVDQVLIEARIVSVSSNFEKELGIKWGLSQPSNNSNSGSNSGLSMDLGLTGGATSSNSASLAIAELGNGIFLDMELSALETEGKGEIISSPKLLTSNRKTAFIEQGEEIPYEESTSSGATAVTYKKAVLSLEVTPVITADNKIRMDLKVSQDSPSTTLTVKGTPGVNTRQIKTQVLVDNGKTIVLGGIYEDKNSRIVTRIPFFGSLPFIGGLFRSTQTTKGRSELLIFITPTIVPNGKELKKT